MATVAKRHQSGFTCITIGVANIFWGNMGPKGGIWKMTKNWRPKTDCSVYTVRIVHVFVRSALVYICGYKWANMILFPSTCTGLLILTLIISASKYYKSELNFKLLSIIIIVVVSNERWSIQRHPAHSHIFHRYYTYIMIIIIPKVWYRCVHRWEHAFKHTHTHIKRKYLYFQISRIIR